MRSKIFCWTIVAIILFPALLPRAADVDRSTDEQELAKIENEWGESYIKRDPSFAERITADDFTFVEADGNIVEKTSYVTGIKGNTVFKQFKIEDLRIRIYGETAIVIGLATIMAQDDHSDVTGRYAFTDVFVRQTGEWKAVSGHVTAIAKNRVEKITIPHE